ncbi:hypothetical protein PVAP13_1KG073977, partial [Panicum virgatum]
LPRSERRRPTHQPGSHRAGSLPATCPRAAPPHLNVPPSPVPIHAPPPLLPPSPADSAIPHSAPPESPRRIRAPGGARGGDLPNRLAAPRAGAPGMMLAAACAFLLFGGSAGDANVGRACAVVAALAVSLRGVCV